MKKYRMKKKKNISVFFIFVVMVVILSVMGTGYSLWNAKLTIYGTATTIKEVGEPAVAPAVPNSNGSYATIVDSNALLGFINLITVTSSSVLNDNEGIVVNAQISGWVFRERTVTIEGAFDMSSYENVEYVGTDIIQNTVTEQAITTNVTMENKVANLSTVIPINSSTGTSTIEFKVNFLTEAGYKYSRLIVNFTK